MFRYAAAALLAGASAWAHAAGTPAGTSISNTATATFKDPAGTTLTATSNTHSVTVDEVLDLVLVRNDAGNVGVATPDSNKPISFTLTNTGNGSEAFALSVNAALAGDQFDPTNVRVYLDNGDGVFSAVSDTLYSAGVNDPVLSADAARILFVVSDIPGGLANGDIGLASLSAAAATGTGAAGTTFAGQGAGGGDAVVGSSGASDSEQGGYVVSTVSGALAKTHAVLDPHGGSNAIPGAVITYTLTFTLTGSGAVTEARIVDAIPANTTYVAGSLQLNGAGLTDAADGDAGRLNTATAPDQIEVTLGTGGSLTAPSTQTVVFKVTIN